MSHNDLGEMDQLDGLAAELMEAGILARVAAAHRERPEPHFATRLRAELLRELPSPFRVGEDVAEAQAVAIVPMPPDRPVDAAGRFIERRNGSRPFAGPDRRWSSADAEPLEVIFGIEPQDSDLVAARRRSGSQAATAAGPISGHDIEVAAAEVRGEGRPEDGLVAPLKPSMRWHIPTRVLPSRWIAVGMAASVAVASLIYGSGIFWPVRTAASAQEAVAATLVRGGAATALTTGLDLRPGDEIKVAVTGRATLSIGGSLVRMAGGSDVQLTSLDPTHVVVNQMAGRVYHRVAVAAGGDYQVTTATVTWEAVGTAFDLDRHATAGGGEEVRGMALYDDVAVRGPQLQATLAQGTSATITLGADGTPTGAAAMAPITAQMLADGWLVTNASLDARLGLPLGQLAALMSPEATVPPTLEPTTVPAELPSDTPTAAPTDAPVTPAPTAPPAPPQPTPKHTPARTPTPVPTAPPVQNLALTTTPQADGSVKLNWSKYTGPFFQYYAIVRWEGATEPVLLKGSDPVWYATTVGSLAVTDKGNLGFGPLVVGHTYHYRVYAFTETILGNPAPACTVGTILGRSNPADYTAVPAATPPPTQDLGALVPHDNGDQTWTFSWTAYTGGLSSYYKLVFGPASGGDPVYPGYEYWAVPTTSATSFTLTVGAMNGGSQPFLPGDYKVRLQAIGYPGGSAYAYAQTIVLHLIVPTSSPSPT